MKLIRLFYGLILSSEFATDKSVTINSEESRYLQYHLRISDHNFLTTVLNLMLERYQE